MCLESFVKSITSTVDSFYNTQCPSHTDQGRNLPQPAVDLRLLYRTGPIRMLATSKRKT